MGQKFTYTSTPTGSNWFLDEILSNKYAIMEYQRTNIPDNINEMAEEEAAESVPDQYVDGETTYRRDSLVEQITKLQEMLEASKNLNRVLEARLSGQALERDLMEQDIAAIRQAIGQEEMDRILGEVEDEYSEPEIKLIEKRRKVKWLSR